MRLTLEDELSQQIQRIRSLIARSRMRDCANREEFLEEARTVLSSVMSDVDLFIINLRDIGTNRRELAWFVTVIDQQPTKSMIPTLEDLLKDKF